MQTGHHIIEAAVVQLRALIDAGQFKGGDRLPSERTLIEQLRMSRATVRHALQQLEDSGVIWRHVGKGTFLSGTTPAEAPASADPVLSLARRTTPVKMMQARLAIEPSIAREAAINASGEALDRIAMAQRATLEAPDWDTYEAADDDFHRAIAEASDNIPLVAIFNRLNSIRRSVTWGNVMRGNERPPADHGSFREHARVAEAITGHDSETAQSAMRAHLKAVSLRLFGDI